MLQAHVRYEYGSGPLSVILCPHFQRNISLTSVGQLFVLRGHRSKFLIYDVFIIYVPKDCLSHQTGQTLGYSSRSSLFTKVPVYQYMCPEGDYSSAWADPEVGRGRGSSHTPPPPPRKSQVAKGFLRNSGTDHP